MSKNKGPESYNRLEMRMKHEWMVFRQVFGAISKYPKNRADIRVFAKRLLTAAHDEEIELIKHIAGPSGDINCVGYCEICGINLYGDNVSPSAWTMPCNLKGCSYE